MKYNQEMKKHQRGTRKFNIEFNEARWLRVLAVNETEDEENGVRNTIVFQGSARINEEDEKFKKNGYDRYYTDAYEL